MDWHSPIAVIGSGAVCAVFAYGIRALLWMVMRNTTGGNTLLPTGEDTSELPPAELAYLLRDGDMTHTMLVLIVDLVQRAVKLHGTEEGLVLRPYESSVWGNVKDFVKTWTTQKVDQIIPLSAPRSPIQWAARINAMRVFFGQTLHGIMRDLIKDPLQIRKYFSWSGIMRFALQLYTSAAKQGVEDSMRAILQNKGLLIPEGRRHAFSVFIAIIAPLSMFCLFLIQKQYVPDVSMIQLVFLAMSGVFNAVAVKVLLTLPRLIPSYDEFLQISSHIPRPGVRMRVLRAVMRSARVLIVSAVIVMLAILLSVQTGVFEIIFKTAVLHLTALLLAASILGFPVVQVCIDFYDLQVRDHASARALALMHKKRVQLSQTPPLTSLRNMLSDSDYDETFSDLVAIYGIETLWLLS